MTEENSGEHKELENLQPGDKIVHTKADGTKASCELIYTNRNGLQWEAAVICPDGINRRQGFAVFRDTAIHLACSACPGEDS